MFSMRMLFVAGCCCLLSACAGTASKPAPTKVERANESGITISAEFNAPNIRKIAEAHCAKYGKTAYVDDAVPIGDSVNSGFVFGVKPYLFSYTCL